MKPKRPNLRWKGDAGYYDHGGKPRKWEHLGDDEAVVLARWQRIHDAGKPEHGTCDKMVADLLADPNFVKERAAGTLRMYRIFRGHLGAVFGPSEPHTITQAAILRYYRLCERKSVRGEIGLLSMAYDRFMDLGRLDFNPCLGVKARKPPSRRTRLITDAELDSVIGKTPERVAVAIELGYATGLRIGDLCALRWADLSESVKLQKTGRRLHFTRTPELDAILARCRALQARIASLYVLCARGGRQWQTDALRRQWRAACRRAGVPDARFHDIRAMGATRIDREHGRHAAQAYLGHTSPASTEIYLRDRSPPVVTPLVRKKA